MAVNSGLHNLLKIAQMSIQNCIQLIYVSKPTKKFKLEELDEIVSISQRNNEKINVGGCLIFEANLFLQILEGESDVVQKLFEKISKDDRHHAISVLSQEQVKERMYSDWSMKKLTGDMESKVFNAMKQILKAMSLSYVVLERYTHPIVRKVLSTGKDPSQIDVVDEKKSVLFCDLVNFTDFTNAIPSGEHTKILNEFLSIISRTTKEFGGNPVSFTGDCVFSEFDNAFKALQSTKKMLNGIRDLDKKYPNVKIQISIGLSFGKVSSGSFGNQDHAQYTMYGATVNRAARIESKTRSYPYHLLFDDEFIKEARKYGIVANVVEVCKASLKGFKQPVQLFSVDKWWNKKEKE